VEDAACKISPTHETKTFNHGFIPTYEPTFEHSSSAVSLDEAGEVAAPTSFYLLPDAAREKPQAPSELNPFSTQLPPSLSDAHKQQIGDSGSPSFDTKRDIESAFQSFRSLSSSPHTNVGSPNRICSSMPQQPQISSASSLSVSFDAPVFTSDPFAPTMGRHVAHSASGGQINNNAVSTTLKSSCPTKDTEFEIEESFICGPTTSIFNRASISPSPRKRFTPAMNLQSSPPRVVMKARGTREARENYEAVTVDSNALDTSNENTPALDDATKMKQARKVKVLNSRSSNTSCSYPLKNQMDTVTGKKDLKKITNFHATRAGKENEFNTQENVLHYEKKSPSSATSERIAAAMDQCVQQRQQTSTRTNTVTSTQKMEAPTTTSSRRPRSSQKDISYAEPSLNSKLRRGDKFYPNSDLMAIELPR
jgi:hypothetical protein